MRVRQLRMRSGTDPVLRTHCRCLRTGLRCARTATSFTTIQHEATCEEVIKKSRFVAFASPVDSPDSAQAYVRSISDLKANHNCFAWRLADGSQRSSDDGEPAGTAGPPILTAITNADLHDVVVVVQRVFGGIKLGTGGLVRAYGGLAAQCLRSCERVQRAAVARLRVRFAPGDTGAVYATLGRYSPRERQHGDGSGGGTVEVEFDAPLQELAALSSALRETTQGRVQVEALEGT